MKLQDLTDYAKRKYRLTEQYKWKEHPGFSVIIHPATGRWAALLMRHPDMYTGGYSESCDLRIGRENKLDDAGTCTFAPQRMRGSDWINIPFNELTKRKAVEDLFDKAIEFGLKGASTIVISPAADPERSEYHDTDIPYSEGGRRRAGTAAHDRIRKMRALYRYGRKSKNDEAKYFYLQAKYMEDCEDDAPWDMVKDYIQPCYQDLTARELRGYFSWRTAVRKGIYKPIPGNLEYIYISELLNGIGAETPEDCLRKMDEFQESYLQKGMGDKKLIWSLKKWKLEYAIINKLPPETAFRYCDQDILKREHMIEILEKPEDYPDDEVYQALIANGKNNLHQLAEAKYPGKSRRIYAGAWRLAVADRFGSAELFADFFKKRKQANWYPLADAVYYYNRRAENCDYYLTSNHSYHARNGQWTESLYSHCAVDQRILQEFIRAAESGLREQFKIHRYQKKNETDQWASPYIERAIENDRLAEMEALRPRILEDLSGLDKIRRDASKTRDSLIVEDDTEAVPETAYETQTAEGPPAEEPEQAAVREPEKGSMSEETASDLPLSALQYRIIRALLGGEAAGSIILEHKLMPSIVADEINEALYDEFGDVVILCEDDTLEIVEEYQEDLASMIL